MGFYLRQSGKILGLLLVAGAMAAGLVVVGEEVVGQFKDTIEGPEQISAPE